MPPRIPPQPVGQGQAIAVTRSRFQCLYLNDRKFSSSNTSRADQEPRKPRIMTRQRVEMFQWLNGPGAVFKHPLPGSTNYLSAYDARGRLLRLRDSSSSGKRTDEEAEADAEDNPPKQMNVASGEPIPPERRDDFVPFPANRNFISEPVLSDELKQEIFERVTVYGKSVKLVSAELNVEMSRVAAVVRLLSIEKNWEEEGKPLAKIYHNAVLAMLPKTPYMAKDRFAPVHESINDLPVHPATNAQLFIPTSESRQYTRIDAGRAFANHLLPADERIPHPELIKLEQQAQEGVTLEERRQVMADDLRKEDDRRRRRREVYQEHLAARTTIVPGRQGAVEWRLEDIKVTKQSVGETGRAKSGVGARYGFPHEDRKRGAVKIPTRVD